MCRIFFLLIFLIGVFSGCGIRDREAALEKREAVLAQKEQELIIREQALVKDSINQLVSDSMPGPLPDSLQLVAPTQQPAITGTWHVKMVCRETSCPGSAVGDTKSENWIFEGDSTAIIARVMAGNNLVRVYTGTLAGNTLEMTEAVGTHTDPQGTQIRVRINMEGEKSKTGTREILQKNVCRILYDLKLDKQTL